MEKEMSKTPQKLTCGRTTVNLVFRLVNMEVQEKCKGLKQQMFWNNTIRPQHGESSKHCLEKWTYLAEDHTEFGCGMGLQELTGKIKRSTALTELGRNPRSWILITEKNLHSILQLIMMLTKRVFRWTLGLVLKITTDVVFVETGTGVAAAIAWLRNFDPLGARRCWWWTHTLSLSPGKQALKLKIGGK